MNLRIFTLILDQIITLYIFAICKSITGKMPDFYKYKNK